MVWSLCITVGTGTEARYARLNEVKALFISLPAHGHTNPTLPLVRELAARGEEVVYYSSPAFQQAVEAADASYRPYQNAFLSELRGLPDRLDQLPWLLMRTTAEVLGTQLEEMKAEQPDYVITDSVAPWGQWVGEALDVPVVTSVCTFAMNRRVLAYGLSKGTRPKSAPLLASKIRHIWKAMRLQGRLRRRSGLKGPGMERLMSGCSGLNIVYTSRHFQPCANTFDESYRFVGPSIAPRTDQAPFPWDQVQHPVIIYVSLGTIFHGDASFYRSCCQALGGMDCQVILSVGSNEMAASLGNAPPNFIVVTRAPQLEVLSRARAFVSHGGMNSVSESLYYGVPLVVVPQMSEQHIVGRRTEELGAGICFAPAEATPERLKQSVQRLLTEDQFRAHAGRIRESFLAAGGVAQAASDILSYVASAKKPGTPKR